MAIEIVGAEYVVGAKTGDLDFDSACQFPAHAVNFESQVSARG